MGIPRFTSFVDNNFTGWLREEIKGKLVIDGFSLCYHLYSYDWSHGGQYSEYRDNVAHCFISMTQSGISPIVVLDGVDYKEEKVETIMKRRNNAVKTVHKHTSSNQKRQREVLVDGVLPPLTYRVFLMVMMELNIKFIVADGEGDTTIYELANMYSCPVLSKDSDFLMYKLKGGYIPLNRFHWEATPINGEVYYYHAFCSQMKFSDPDLRLVIPAIVGNDFLSPVDSEVYIAYMAKRSLMNGRGHHHQRLSTITRYIGQFESLEHFTDHIQSIPCLGENDKGTLRENCANVRDSYDSEKTTTLEKLNKTTQLLAFNSEELPEWILKQFRTGNLYCMEALVLGKYLQDIFIDDTSVPSCIQASGLIRKFIYGLTGFSLVTEFCREGLQLVGRGVHASTTINDRPLPSLSRIPTLPASEREHLFYSMLGCMDDPMLLRLPEYWKLVMAATKFWVRHCSPSQHQIKALILNFVVYATCPEEVQKMHVQFEIPFQFIRSPRWMPLLHTFAQWQSIYGDAISLNQLLMLPLDPVSPARLYDGRLVMFFAYPENDDFLAGRLPIDHRLYDDLVEIVVPRPAAVHRGIPQSRRGGGSNMDQPPRFRSLLPSSSSRGGPPQQRGRGRGQWNHDHGGQATTRKLVQERSKTTEEPSWRPRGSSRKDYAATAGGHGQVRGRGRGGSRDDPGGGWHDTGPAGGRGGGSSSKGRQKSSRGTSAKSSSARTQVVKSEQPKFAHANRFSSLMGDDVISSDDTDSSSD